MSFETVSLLLSWVELGVLLAILFRLGHTFELIASTQRELRRAIHHLGEQRAAELGINNAFGGQGIASVSRSPGTCQYREHHGPRRSGQPVAVKSRAEGWSRSRPRS